GALRHREQTAAQLLQRSHELQDEREAHARLSVRYERARIASELHDIVAHAITVMVVQAGAGQRLVTHDRASTADTFAVIADAGRQAEQDIGRLVALLADEQGGGAAPDIDLAQELVERAAASGLDVTLRLDGTRDNLPAPIRQLAYRALQEGLTNALRYAPGATVSVRVRSERETLLVEVVNGPATRDKALVPSGSGNGLRGLRERVSASGGTIDAQPTSDGGWALTAHLSCTGAQTSGSPRSSSSPSARRSCRS
ncbi:MAG: histidine kinase, partial [Actinobacteria bacterium]|nr:histidine kinase [Actinomycetota bacterium]